MNRASTCHSTLLPVALSPFDPLRSLRAGFAKDRRSVPVPEVGSAILSGARIPFGGLDRFHSCTFDPPQAT